MVLSEILIEEIIQRASDQHGYQQLERAARATRFCSRPIRLASVDSTQGAIPGSPGALGPSPHDYEEVYMKACGTRRRTLCESCSEIYQGDVRQLVRSGLLGGKGVPEEVSGHPAIFATLTAPSFGPVHRSITKGGRSLPCHVSESGSCPHGRSLGCLSVHQNTDEIVGSPICPECYDYKGAVIWNAASTKLWQRTTIYMRRALARLVGIPVSELSTIVRISYAKVIEYQRRGLIHVHLVIRGDDPEDRSLAPSPDITPELIGLALRMAISQVIIKVDIDGISRQVRWGNQVDVRSIDGTSTGAVANYIAKYATKSANESGGLDHRFQDRYQIESSTVPRHLREMALTAWDLGQDPKYSELNLGMWAHDLGHRGHFLTKSRRFSVTLSYLRQIRQSWSESQRIEQGAEAEQMFTCDDEFHFVGQGWMFSCDSYLVAQRHLERCEGRMIAKEVIAEEALPQGALI